MVFIGLSKPIIQPTQHYVELSWVGLFSFCIEFGWGLTKLIIVLSGKKLDKKEKSLREREAKVDLERVRIEKIKANENNEVAKPTNVEIKDENENEPENINCRHIPQ